ncbi:molybdate ABC transporter permease subunit [Vulgatibacter sp.]|uniref:molybdate ABC transporter permease subunit n=1 Tax=Vulgatibacter sp. TaxID=1971226 RepID=UPI0035667179
MQSRARPAALATAAAIGGLGLWAAIGTGEGASAAAVTLRVVGLATLLALGAGLPAAFLLARWQSPLRPFVEALLLTPLVLPPTVTGFALAALLGEDGPLGFLGLVLTWQGAAVAGAVVAFPLFLRAARPALSAIDGRYAALARTLGAGSAATLFRVTLPLAAPGLLTGTALAVGRALGEFGATLMVAGSIPGATRTLPLAVYAAFKAEDDGQALGLSLILVAVAVVLVGAAALLERRGP